MKRDLKDYTRVSEVSSYFTDFSHIDPSVLENAANRGTRVHGFCEQYAKKTLFMSPDEDCLPYFESFKLWYDEMVSEVHYIEERLFCDEHKITGQVDFILTLKGEKNPIILDLKTPQNESKSWRLQTSAYLYLAKQNLDIEVNRRGCLMLDRKGGDARFKEYTSEHDERLFFNTLELIRFFK